jgi:predicted dehydrogenase
MLKAGLIGAGYIGETHAIAYASLPDVQLTTIVDRNLPGAQKLAERFGAHAVADLDAIIASDLDLVSICTPTPTHMELANRLMQAGKHVLCEKPIAFTLDQARSMIDTAARTGVKFMVAHVSRYEADHRKARDIVARGDIGSLRMAFHSITSTFPGWSMKNWLGDESKSGGPVVDLAIHGVDYLCWLFQSPVDRVYAVGSQKVTGNNHYALVQIHFASGGLGLIETSWAHPPSLPLACSVELTGSQGRIAWNYNQIEGMQTFIEGQPRVPHVLEGENGYAAEIADFIHCIQNDLPAPVPGEEAMTALQVCLAARESLLTGRCVELGRC